MLVQPKQNGPVSYAELRRNLRGRSAILDVLVYQVLLIPECLVRTPVFANLELGRGTVVIALNETPLVISHATIVPAYLRLVKL